MIRFALHNGRRSCNVPTRLWASIIESQSRLSCSIDANANGCTSRRSTFKLCSYAKRSLNTSQRWDATTINDSPSPSTSSSSQHAARSSRGASSPAVSREDTLDLPSADKKWQAVWERLSLEKAKNGDAASRAKEKAYILPMFPYPSGDLHMGHLRVYTISDTLARWKHMDGFSVLNPMGWDAFGLPAENAAIERGVNPAAWTKQNIENMRALLKSMNTDFMWDREFATCDPAFYKHTQKLFLLLYERGLAYQTEGLVNWDPVDQTVLANEQVDNEGNSWRSGAKVESRMLKQWYLKVTAFKEDLLRGLDDLAKSDNWPARVTLMQRNWIGRSTGAQFKFGIRDERKSVLSASNIEVFTTRPDTLLGVQFIALASSHPIVQERAKSDETLRSFLSKMPSMPEDSKEGFLLQGIQAINPAASLEGIPSNMNLPLPVYVAPYVLDNYGEGAVMGVPGHDERDLAFWRRNSPESSVLSVVESDIPAESDSAGYSAVTRPGKLNSHCGAFEGLASETAGQRFVHSLGKVGLGAHADTWRLRDWLVSRQRYWGTPIPIIHCDKCGPVPVPDEQLPVELPNLDGDSFKGKTGNPLESARDWLEATCPSCHSPAKRETDTMDTFVDSSWYFMRFPDSDNHESLFSEAVANKMLPVDIYVGGVEHAILHLLYARFVSKFLAGMGLWPDGNLESNKAEPFRRLVAQGMVHGKTFTDAQTGRFLRSDEVDVSEPSNPKIKSTGVAAEVSFQKMSKSKYNGLNPTESIGRFGADVVRAHVLFAAPVMDVLDWDESKVVGVERWLFKTWRCVCDVRARLDETSADQRQGILQQSTNYTENEKSALQSLSKLQQHVADIHQSLETTSLNTLISNLMKLTSHVIQSQGVSLALDFHQLSVLLRAMAPVTPAFAEESWALLNGPTSDVKGSFEHSFQDSIFSQSYPRPNAAIAASVETQTCAVQQNGKLRFTLQIPVLPNDLGPESAESSTTTAREDWILAQLANDEAGARWLQKHPRSSWKRIIVIKGGKTVNFVG